MAFFAHTLGCFAARPVRINHRRYICQEIVNTPAFKLFHEVITVSEEEALLAFLETKLKRRRYEGGHWDAVIRRYKEIEVHPSMMSERCRNVLDCVREKITCALAADDRLFSNEPPPPDFLEPHVIDLAADGAISGHIDSVKFSGDFIAGLSLMSSRIMVLKLEREESQPSLESPTLNVGADSSRSDGSEGSYIGQGIGQGSGTERSSSSYVKQRSIEGAYPLPADWAFPETLHLELPPRSLYLLRGPMRYRYSHAVLGAPAADTDRTDATDRTEAAGDTYSAMGANAVDVVAGLGFGAESAASSEGAECSAEYASLASERSRSAVKVERRISVIFRNAVSAAVKS